MAVPATDSQSARFSDTLLAIRTRLTTVLDLDASRVRIVATDKYRIACAEPQFLYLRYYGLKPDTDAGVGRRARRATRLLRVYVYSRSNVDEYGSDVTVLTGSEAHGDFEDAVFDALDNFRPLSDEDEPLTIEPLHPVDDQSGPPEREPEDDVGLIRSSLLFEINYLPPKNDPAL